MLRKSFQRTALSAAILIASGQLMAGGVIDGRVSDQSEAVFFDGAIVSIKGTSLTTVATSGGRFRFNNVPAGQYVLLVSYVGAEPVEEPVRVVDDELTTENVKIGEDVEQIENVLVVGQAAGVFSAINQMRGADNLVSIVTSDSIGQLPDENVSEALQRISGVFIERDQGEGRFVGIRGIDPKLNVASINGLNLPSPESDVRNVALDVIPSDLVESLEVTKTLTPDQDGDAIGGTINIKSLSAFDREGMSYKVTGQYYLNDLEDDDGYKVSGAFTNVFEVAGGELGVAFSASTNERNFGTDTIEADGGWDDAGNGLRSHQELEFRNYQITREREGFALNLDYRPDENSNYYLRTLYSEFSDQEFRNRIEFKIDDAIVNPDESATSTNTEIQRELKDRFETQEIASVLLGGENIFDDWKFEYSLGFSEAKEDEPGRIDSQFEYKSLASFSYGDLGGAPSVAYSTDGLDPANFELDEIVVENNSSTDEETAFKFDITKDMTFAGNPGYIKFGAKLRMREKQSDLNAVVYEDFADAINGGASEVLLSDFVQGSTDYTLGNYGPYIDYRLQRNFVAQNIGNFIIDDDDTELASSLDYVIEEDVTAAYIMSRVDIDKLRVVYGVRYEQTEINAAGAFALENEGNNDVRQLVTSSDYSHVLPSINVRYEATDQLILRAAYSQSIARPSFGDLSPVAEGEVDGGDLEAEIGNPDLQPFESQNIDLSLEYYPESLGVFAAGVFYKQIDNFIFDIDVAATFDVTDLGLDSSLVTADEVIKPLNGESADLYGLELGWTRQFDELPAPFDGLLLQANATFTDSDADLGLAASGRSSPSALPLQADTIANFVIGYEKYGLSLRLSSAYISERLDTIELDDERNDLYEDAHSQIDFSAKYDFSDNLQLFFNVINLNEESNYRYYGSERYIGQYDEIGRSFALGLTYRNF